ncbi:MAG TPA: shikimate dehydrogenase [Armatimonadota bacterium]|nr:shikimate dehydrogenase [Armatimonadota bacterium]
MERFGFIIHPLDAKRDVARKYPFVKFLPESIVEWGLTKKSSMLVSHITGVKSKTGVEAEGWFVGCPLTPKQMLSLPKEFVYKKIIDAAKIAQDMGAKIVGLGAFTSVVGDGGRTIAQNVDIAITTGNSFTVATAVDGAVKAARLMDIDPAAASVAVVGAAGSIGRTCAQILSRQAAHITLVGLATDPLEKVAEELRTFGSAEIGISSNVEQGIREADIVVTVSSATDAIVEPSYIKTGAVVCDVARPRDVSKRVVEERDDVLVIDGGVVAVPGDVEFNFSFGFPPKTAYACMSETMALSLEARYECFTLGKELTLQQVEEISAICSKHGFELAGFRSFEKAVTDEQIETIRQNAKRRKSRAK